MRRNKTGFTLIEILVVIGILSVLIGMTSLIVPRALEQRDRAVCQKNVSELVALIETEGVRMRAPGGPALLLRLVRRGELAGADALERLFCPGDADESLDAAGGAEAYVDLSDHSVADPLTSYAGRDLARRECRISGYRMPPSVLLADDSEDHHAGRGFIVGLTGGTAKWRNKLDHYKTNINQHVQIGEGSQVEELACLRTN